MRYQNKTRSESRGLERRKKSRGWEEEETRRLVFGVKGMDFSGGFPSFFVVFLAMI